MGVAESAHNQSDVERILQTASVRYIVVEKNMPLHFSSQSALRHFLDNSGRYKPLETVPIETNLGAWQGRSLILYESTTSGEPPRGILHIKMLHMRHDIDIPFEQLTGKSKRNR